MNTQQMIKPNIIELTSSVISGNYDVIASNKLLIINTDSQAMDLNASELSITSNEWNRGKAFWVYHKSGTFDINFNPFLGQTVDGQSSFTFNSVGKFFKVECFDPTIGRCTSVGGIGAGGGGATTDNILWVFENGIEAGTRGELGLPYSHPAYAMDDYQSGDLVKVGPGTYDVSSLLGDSGVLLDGDEVNIELMKGAILYIDDADYMFDASGFTDSVLNIFGEGKIVVTNTGVDQYLVNLTSSSNFIFNCDVDIETEGSSFTTTYLIDSGRINLRGNYTLSDDDVSLNVAGLPGLITNIYGKISGTTVEARPMYADIEFISPYSYGDYYIRPKVDAELNIKYNRDQSFGGAGVTLEDLEVTGITGVKAKVTGIDFQLGTIALLQPKIDVDLKGEFNHSYYQDGGVLSGEAISDRDFGTAIGSIEPFGSEIMTLKNFYGKATDSGIVHYFTGAAAPVNVDNCRFELANSGGAPLDPDQITAYYVGETAMNPAQPANESAFLGSGCVTFFDFNQADGNSFKTYARKQEYIRANDNMLYSEGVVTLMNNIRGRSTRKFSYIFFRDVTASAGDPLISITINGAEVMPPTLLSVLNLNPFVGTSQEIFGEGSPDTQFAMEMTITGGDLTGGYASISFDTQSI